MKGIQGWKGCVYEISKTERALAVEGVFAAGDLTGETPCQIATAVG